MNTLSASRIIRYVGRTLLTIGALVLLFVVFQLWGTGLHEAKAQRALTEQFDRTFAAESTSTTSPSSTATSTISPAPTVTAPPKPVAAKNIAPKIGEPVGRIRIPAIHLNKIIVQGVSLTQLDRAPGHYPQTPFPGQAGNASIAGHRTTYGAPFERINKLVPGDKIFITTLQGHFVYAVQWTKIVRPDAMWVVGPSADAKHPNTLTLTACHPRGYATHRYILRAVLLGKPVPHMRGQNEATRQYEKHSAGDKIAGGVSAASHPGAWPPAIGWGLVCAAIWIAAWYGSRRWREGTKRTASYRARAMLPYAIGLPLFLWALFLSFENVAQLIPAGL